VTWQECQEAVAVLYEQLDGIGTVRRNVSVPDRVTGTPRQVDVLVELNERGHALPILVDAKFRKNKADVKDVEEVVALTAAVGTRCRPARSTLGAVGRPQAF